MLDKLKLQGFHENSDKRREEAGLKNLKGKISLKEHIVSQTPFYYVDIDLKNISLNDIEYIIERLNQLKIELADKDLITQSHMYL
jgi:hypothetical protein